MNIPPSFRFTGDKERALSLKSEALQFSKFTNNQAELGGVSFLHRERVLTDGSIISVTTHKGGYNLRTNTITIFGQSTPVSIIKKVKFKVSHLSGITLSPFPTLLSPYQPRRDRLSYLSPTDYKTKVNYFSGNNVWINPDSEYETNCITWNNDTMYIGGKYKYYGEYIVACESYENVVNMVRYQNGSFYLYRLRVIPTTLEFEFNTTLISPRLGLVVDYLGGAIYSGGFSSKGELYIRRYKPNSPSKIFKVIFNSGYTNYTSETIFEDQPFISIEDTSHTYTLLPPNPMVYATQAEVTSTTNINGSQNGYTLSEMFVHLKTVDIVLKQKITTSTAFSRGSNWSKESSFSSNETIYYSCKTLENGVFIDSSFLNKNTSTIESNHWSSGGGGGGGNTFIYSGGGSIDKKNITIYYLNVKEKLLVYVETSYIESDTSYLSNTSLVHDTSYSINNNLYLNNIVIDTNSLNSSYSSERDLSAWDPTSVTGFVWADIPPNSSTTTNYFSVPNSTIGSCVFDGSNILVKYKIYPAAPLNVPTWNPRQYPYVQSIFNGTLMTFWDKPILDLLSNVERLAVISKDSSILIDTNIDETDILNTSGISVIK